MQEKPLAIAERRTAVTRLFETYYGAPPVHWARAPGRVDLMGSHTDYNMGYVMTMTIDRDTWVVTRPRTDGLVRIRSFNAPGESIFDLEDVQRDEKAAWSNYVRGMARVMQEAGHRLAGFDGLVDSTVPFGSGLSSSAAIEMASGVAWQQVSGFELQPLEMALLGQRAENEFVGVNCGILDQYSSAMGKAGSALKLDCRHLTHEDVPIAEGIAVVIGDTKSERQLIGSEYDDRRAQTEMGAQLLGRFDPRIKALRDVPLPFFNSYERALPPVVARRCRFVIEENQRVLDLAELLPDGDRTRLGELCRASYEGARDLYEIEAPAMAAMYLAMNGGPGLIGARQAGAGFGGCLVALVEEGQVGAFAEYVEAAYQAETGIEPEVYQVKASPGAGRLELPASG